MTCVTAPAAAGPASGVGREGGLVDDDVAAAFGQILGAVVLERGVVRRVVVVIRARNRILLARHAAFVPGRPAKEKRAAPP